MKERGENFLKNLRAPAPDPEARVRAKRAALAEFARTQATQAAANQDTKLPLFQALRRRLRLSRDQTSHGSAPMKGFHNRGLYAAAAGLGVLAIGLSWVLPNVDRYNQQLTHPEVAASLPAEAPVPAEHDAPQAMLGDDDANQRGQVAAAPAKPAADLATQDQREAFEARAKSEQQSAALTRERGEAGRQNDASPAAATSPAPAPPPPPASAAAASEETEEIMVTGVRGSLQQSLEVKRAPVGVEDKKASEPARRMAGISAGNAAQGAFYQDEGRDRFEHFDDNPINPVDSQWRSTFSADVDTASYSFVRGRLNAGMLPQKDSVRAEEMINYFDYSWPAADSRRAPFKPTVVVSDSPWNKGRKLVHIGIKGYELDSESAPDANLVLLLDVSGSMNSPDKLPLAVRSMELLLDSLKPSDTVGIVVYAGAAGTVLEPTPVREKERILAALRSLRPGGSTAGAAGIERAYQLAEAHYRKGGVNRILLATDGDFNVGINDTNELKGFVERKREKGVYLSVLGFGRGNYRDELAQALAQNGNGVAAYIDTENEARKVLVREASGSLFTIAKDVKLQVEFNPETVSEFRLVGYETRALKHEDFNNDTVDAGDVGAGHTVTAIYEITPVGAATLSSDPPRYPGNRVAVEGAKELRGRAEYGFLKIRYKLPNESKSQLISEPIPLRTKDQAPNVSRDVAFSTAVAGFAQLLRGNGYTGDLGYDDILRQAQASKGNDPHGYRAEFIALVRKAQSLQ